MVGLTVGHYRIETQLGAGGMGVVYRARDLRLNRSVALKVLAPAPAGSAASEELLHEGRAASALNHPNVCTVHEVGEEHGQLFMVMELVEGSPLGVMIPPSGLPIDQVLQYGIQVANALEHAHERGVVHGDLKTANVMVTPDGRAKVLDFGLARRQVDALRDQTTQVVDAGANVSMAGTLAYMSPEMLRGQPASAASDIWAAGVLLYEISTGKLPFQGTTTFDLTASILRESVTPPTHVPPALRTVILRCLAKEPGQRYRRAGEIRAALEAVDSSARVTRDDIAHRVSRPPWPWIAATAAVVIAAAAGIPIWRRLAPPSWPTGGHWVRLATGDGRAFDPSLSQDGKMVAYVAEAANGQLDLFVARVAGGSPIALTNDAALESYPRFSADGERIVFARRPVGSTTSEICVIPTLGGESRTLVVNAATPVWSPSGARLAFIRREPRDNVMELATSAADGGDVQVLLRGDGTYPFLRSPAWSPDGRQVAVARSRGGIAADIWTVPAGGGAPVKIAAEGTSIFNDDPVFTPDGRAIIYSSNRGGATNLWAIPLGGGSPVRLTNGPGPDESPTIARDGTIALVNTRWRHVLFVHDLETGETKPLHAETPFIWAPAWSPDASQLAFSRGDADGTWHIWGVAAGGGAPRQLTTSPLGEVYPRYLPDGGLLYHTWEAPHRIWRVPQGGGPPVAVTDGPGDQFADISPDGKWLAFVRSEQNAERIYIAPLGGGVPRLLMSSPGSVPRWSPDGKRIAFSKDRGYAGGIGIVGVDGQGERALTDKGGWPVWWPDGQHIGYRIVAADGNQQILVAPVDGGPPVPLDSVKFSGTNEPFDIWRDGRRLASSTAQHVSDEIWMIRQERE